MDLKKRVLKLRWIGNDREADRLMVLLRRMYPSALVLQPPETD
jgi:hypothetical protein